MQDINILIVEDELKVANALQANLSEHGFQVAVAYDGTMGKKMFHTHQFDLLLLDLNLPHINGYELCKEFRQKKNDIPILILTAFGDIEDKVQAFELGADDYLIKPVDFRELLAKVRVFLKRQNPTIDQGQVITVDDLVINTFTKSVSRAGTPINLTAKEFILLELLARNAGRVIRKVEIAEKVWDISFDTGTNVIEVYINFLRKKIDKGFSKKLIHTRSGMGYFIKG